MPTVQVLKSSAKLKKARNFIVLNYIFSAKIDKILNPSFSVKICFQKTFPP